MTFDIVKARNDMIARISATHPVPFGIETNGLECEHNAEHIAEIGNAVCDYLESLLAEAASSMSVGQTDDESVSFIREAINDLAETIAALKPFAKAHQDLLRALVYPNWQWKPPTTDDYETAQAIVEKHR